MAIKSNQEEGDKHPDSNQRDLSLLSEGCSTAHDSSASDPSQRRTVIFQPETDQIRQEEQAIGRCAGRDAVPQNK